MILQDLSPSIILSMSKKLDEEIKKSRENRGQPVVIDPEIDGKDDEEMERNESTPGTNTTF